MDIIDVIREQEQLDLLLFQEGRSKMNIRQIARDFARRHVYECELLEEGLPVPIIPVEDEIIHTDESPICSDPACPCQDYCKAIAPDLDMPSRLVSGKQICENCGQLRSDVEDGVCNTCWQKVLAAIE